MMHTDRLQLYVFPRCGPQDVTSGGGGARLGPGRSPISDVWWR